MRQVSRTNISTKHFPRMKSLVHGTSSMNQNVFLKKLNAQVSRIKHTT